MVVAKQESVKRFGLVIQQHAQQILKELQSRIIIHMTIALKALPSNSQNRKPARICWSFGDGRDTCINYPENYAGLYLVGHRYLQPGQYEVCVKILYYGGCEARNCKNIIIPPPIVECRVRLFEITPLLQVWFVVFMPTPHQILKEE
jgi:hypothetical protein